MTATACILEKQVPIDSSNRKWSLSPAMTPSPKMIRSKFTFNFEENCFYCGSKICERDKTRQTYKISQSETISTRKNILKKCNERNDHWAHVVKGRLESVSDLVAAEAIYHKVCNLHFRTNQDLPSQFKTEHSSITSPSKSPCGRPLNMDQHDAFVHVLEYLELQSEPTTTSELQFVMQTKLKSMNSEKQPYLNKTIASEIQEKYGDTVNIAHESTKPGLITFKSQTYNIISKFHKDQKNKKDEKKHIIETAAKLLLDDCRNVKQDPSLYPTIDDIKDFETCFAFLPDSLQLFMSTVISNKSSDLKTAFLGQSLLQAIRPRSILSPLQFGLGVQLHHHLMSRYVIDLLNKLGVVSSYMEVLRYEENASVTQATDMNLQDTSMLNYIADNADHNPSSLDGHDSLHAMGIMDLVLYGFSIVRHIPRKTLHPNELQRVAKTKFLHYDDTKLKYIKLDSIKSLPVKQSEHF